MRWIKIVVIILLIYGINTPKLIFASTSIKNHKKKDTRVAVLVRYLDRKSSPLMDSAADFLRISDKYKIDWKLLPAIAGVESGFELAGNTHDHNPFGYMCKSSPCYFQSFEQAIEVVARNIATGRTYRSYRQTGSIYQLATIYNQVHPEEWTQKIEYFRSQLK